MQSILARSYPGMKMDLVCKTCKGHSEQTMDRFRCPLCKKNRADYRKLGLGTEVDEFLLLFKTWQQIQKYHKPTTGYKKLDNLLEVLFGKPHDKDWRNYKKYPIKFDSPYIVIRTINLGRVEAVQVEI